MPAITNTLKVHRAMHNLTQAGLADLSGTTRKSINAIETGRMVPSIALALKLARALEVPVDALFALPGATESSQQVELITPT